MHSIGQTNQSANKTSKRDRTITTPGFVGTFTYDGVGNIDLVLTAAPGPVSSTLGNISTRLRVETGDNVLIGGFIVTGTQPKKVIMRAIGPSLPLVDVLANPTLELHDGSGTLLASNDNWMLVEAYQLDN
jgi:hypothetical protein